MTCHTRKLKKLDLFKPTKGLAVGTIHVAVLKFPDGVGVSEQDVTTAVTYLQLAAPKISAYCSQYGSPAIAVDGKAGLIEATKNTYSDADLQGWVNAFIKSNNYGPNDAVVVFNPPNGAENTDAPVSHGILGYHGSSPNPYSFVNVLALGGAFTVDDKNGAYALALSHEIAEMTVDPAADLSNPEVCDPCAGNCGVDYRNYFDANGNWLGGQRPADYAFFVSGVATPAEVKNCPASEGSCSYTPGSSPPPQPVPWWEALLQFILSLLGLGSLRKSYTPPNFLLAQEVHFLAGLAGAFAGSALHFPTLYGVGGILGLALVKELTFDRFIEKQPFFSDGLVDWVFYVLGALAGLLAIVR